MSTAFTVFGDVGRNRDLRRVVVAYAVFTVTEYAVWIAMLVYAYSKGGATLAGAIAIAQLVPAAVVAPLAGPVADRHSPAIVLAGGYAVQGVGAAIAALAVFADLSSLLAYFGAVLASTAVSTTRPSQAALVPALTREVNELTAANVLIGWVESLGILVAGGLVGVTLTFGSEAHVFAISAALLGGAVLLVSPLHRASPGTGDRSAGILRSVASGSAEMWRTAPVRLLVGLLLAEDVVIGAVDVLFVVMAIDLLHAGEAWVGYLNMAYGAGGVILGTLAVFLVGRRLGPVILSTAVLLGIVLAATAITAVPAVVVVLLGIVGGCRAVYDVGTRALLQRAVAPNMVARTFGLAEGLGMIALAAGALVAPALVAVGGGRLALVGIAIVLPAIVIARSSVLMRLDQHARVPIVEISLLRSLPIFRLLPGQALEGLAQALVRVDYAAGDAVVSEGEDGDSYYAIADGRVEIIRGGHSLGMLGRGEGFGEIALLRTGPRTATAVAVTPLRVYALDRESFLSAVNGHVPTSQVVGGLVQDVRDRDARRDSEPGPGEL